MWSLSWQLRGYGKYVDTPGIDPLPKHLIRMEKDLWMINEDHIMSKLLDHNDYCVASDLLDHAAINWAPNIKLSLVEVVTYEFLSKCTNPFKVIKYIPHHRDCAILTSL